MLLAFFRAALGLSPSDPDPVFHAMSLSSLSYAVRYGASSPTFSRSGKRPVGASPFSDSYLLYLLDASRYHLRLFGSSRLPASSRPSSRRWHLLGFSVFFSERVCLGFYVFRVVSFLSDSFVALSLEFP
ncbi:MAG: hypothetical protein QXU75_09265 [Candidatus Methanomethylicaceae archaeon]